MTEMNGSLSLSRSTPWLQRFWDDLQPTPGRLSASLRITLVTVIALVLILVWQVPFATLGLYSVFVVTGESPSVSLRLCIASWVMVLSAIAIELGLVILTDNDPMARLLSVSVITFLAGMMVVSTSLPALGGSWGLIYCTLIAFWESHAPADTLVKNSLWFLAVFSLVFICVIAVEYVFDTRSPVDGLEKAFQVRYEALDSMFSLFARNAPVEQRFETASRVSRLAAAGQAGMIALYNQIVDRNLDTGALPIGTRVHITLLAELMDDAAAFGLQGAALDHPEVRNRCARIAEQCRGLILGRIPLTKSWAEVGPATTNTLLDRVEAAIHSILLMPVEVGPNSKELVALPSNQVPFFIPGAIRDKDNIAFGLKMSLCATFCYILYHAIDWPGVSTSVVTVMVAGLTTTAAMKQRLALRMLGATIGGVIFGLGATVFLFPYMDSIFAFVIVVGCVAFIASWVSGGPRFNYVGLQIAFAFYVVAFEGSSAPTELAPARDRLVGILFALIVMWFVFDQIWPIHTVTAMRRVLASVLRSGARLFELVDSTKQNDQFQREMDSVRDRLGKNISALRNMNEAVEYEFGVDRAQYIHSSEAVLQVSAAAAALIWNQVAVLYGKRDVDVIPEPELVEMRRRLADHLNVLAEAVVQKTSVPVEDLASSLSRSLKDERYREYVMNTIARHEDVQTLASLLGGGR